MVNTWWFFLVLSLVFEVTYNLLVKKILRKSINDGSIIVLIEMLGGLFVLFLSIFFKWKFPNDIKVYILLFLSCIFYALTDRINTPARRELEVSIYGILSQLTPIFTFVWGLLFFKEPIIINKIIGLLLIVSGNIFVLFKKRKFEWNKYVLFSLLGNLFFSIAVCIDVGISEQFNLPFYVSITLIIPAILIMITERISVKSLIDEIKVGDKKLLLAISPVCGLKIFALYMAYQLGSFSTITAIRATIAILNVFAACFFLKEKDSLLKKIIAAILVTIGVILAKL